MLSTFKSMLLFTAAITSLVLSTNSLGARPPSDPISEPFWLTIYDFDQTFVDNKELYPARVYQFCYGDDLTCGWDGELFVVPDGKKLVVNHVTVSAHVFSGSPPAECSVIMNDSWTPDLIFKLDYVDPVLGIWGGSREVNIVYPSGTWPSGIVVWSGFFSGNVRATIKLTGEIITLNP